MFDKEYKHAMDGITPSEEAIAKTLDAMQKENARKRTIPKNTLRIAIVCCLSIAIIATSLFAIFKYSDFGTANDLEGIRRAKDYGEIENAIDKLYKNFTYGMPGVAVDDAEEVILEREEIVSTDEDIKYNSTPDNVPTASDKEYSDTNNQVQGVQEADIVKTDGEYIYYISVNNQKLYISEVSGSVMNQVASVFIESNAIREMLLIDDTICIIANPKEKTVCYYYDVSDRTSPVLTHTLSQDGLYLSSRAIGTDIFVITSFHKVDKNAFNKRTAVIPEINGETIEANDIWIPENISTSEFTVVTAYDAKSNDGEFDSALSVIGASNTMYSGEKNLYLTNSQSGLDMTIDNDTKSPSLKTNIYRIALDKSELAITASGYVPGSILNQFSMDESDGKLRVATHIQLSNVSSDGKSVSYSGEQVNRVYCLGDDMEIIGVSGDMGVNESIKSVRFMGDIAYVVTFRHTDPLYAVDMSDPANPQILSELKIDGFSSYMQQFTDNLLLGIGYEADSKTGIQTGLKLTMFDITDKTNIFDISSYILDWSNGSFSASSATYNHKAVLVSGRKNIIGIPLSVENYDVDYTNGNAEMKYGYKNYYVFFEFDGDKLTEKKRIEVDSDININYQGNEDIRGLYIGDHSYVVCNSGIICLSLDELAVVSELKFN